MSGKAQLLYDEARIALTQQRTDRADRLLRRALEQCAVDDVELRLRIRISSTWVTFERQGLDAALAVLDRLRRSSSRAGLPAVTATAAVQGGIFRARGGDLRGAWRVLSRIDGAALPDPDRVRFLVNRATLASELRRLDEAAADLMEATDLARSLDLLPLAFIAGHNLGWVQFLRGDLPAALAATGEADELEIDVDRGVARLDRARVLLEAGLASEALDVLELLPGAGRQVTAEADLERARAELLLGRSADAIRHARRAARRFAARNEPFWERRCMLAALIARPSAAGALRLWEEASAARDRWVAEPTAAIALGYTRGEPPAQLLRSVRALASSPIVSRRIAGLVALARHDEAVGSLASARRRVRAASTELLRAQLGVASLDLRAAVALHGQPALALDLDLAERIPGRRGIDALVDASERWRAATRPMPRLRPDPDPAIASAAAQLRRVRAEFAAAPGDAELQRAVIDAERELRAKTWTTRAAGALSVETISPPRLRAAARGVGATVAICVPRGRETWVLLLDGRGARKVRLGEEEALAELVAAAHADLTAGASLPEGHPVSAVVRASLAARYEALRRALIAPLGELGRELVVVPSRVLTGVPWSALVDRPVTVSPTASGWAAGARGIEGPVVGALAGPDLDGARREVDDVLGAWRIASAPPSLAEALATCDLVHVAAHGTHRGDNPLFSNLLLDEGVVVAHELDTGPIRASHVVLSACEVGRASHRPGDQPLGLTAALLAAGVACVVAPVAPVGDRLAASVMARYHEGLIAGLDAATSLAAATSGSPAAGAYVCFGSSWRAGITGEARDS